MRTKVLNLGQYPADGEEIKFETSIFPGGEIFFRLAEEKTGGCDKVIIRCRLNTSNDVMQLVMAVDALRRAGHQHLFCSAPYIPYAQQDRVCNTGESLSIKVFADIINSLQFEELYVFDPHSDVSSAVLDRVCVIDNRDLICEALKHVTKVNIICPDAGAAKKIVKVLPCVIEETGFEVNLVMCSKVRDLKTTKIVSTEVPQIENNWPCMIVDDICIGGATFIEIAKRLPKKSLKVLCVSHGIFSNGFEQLKQHFNGIITTTSRKEWDVSEANFVKRLPILQLGIP